MTGLSPQDATALTDALKAEHAAVYVYGVVQAHVEQAAAQLAGQAVEEHRVRRDQAAARLTQAGVTPPAAAPAYTLPTVVTDEPSAEQLALAVEAETAQAWRALVERATVPGLREQGVTAVADCAVRAAQWRKALNIEPATTPFPGEG